MFGGTNSHWQLGTGRAPLVGGMEPHSSTIGWQVKIIAGLPPVPVVPVVGEGMECGPSHKYEWWAEVWTGWPDATDGSWKHPGTSLIIMTIATPDSQLCIVIIQYNTTNTTQYNRR